jgi:hypothetical protein
VRLKRSNPFCKSDPERALMIVKTSWVCVGFLTNRIIDLMAASGSKLESPSKSGSKDGVVL